MCPCCWCTCTGTCRASRPTNEREMSGCCYLLVPRTAAMLSHSNQINAQHITSPTFVSSTFPHSTTVRYSCCDQYTKSPFSLHVCHSRVCPPYCVAVSSPSLLHDPVTAAHCPTCPPPSHDRSRPYPARPTLLSHHLHLPPPHPSNLPALLSSLPIPALAPPTPATHRASPYRTTSSPSMWRGATTSPSTSLLQPLRSTRPTLSTRTTSLPTHGTPVLPPILTYSTAAAGLSTLSVGRVWRAEGNCTTGGRIMQPTAYCCDSTTLHCSCSSSSAATRASWHWWAA